MSTVHRTTVNEFDRMADAGVFNGAPLRVELIEGELRDMNPLRPMHDEVLERLREWSDDHKRARNFRVRSEKPVGLPELESVPMPDLTWVGNRSYMRRRPDASDIFLIAEVADTSLAYDRDVKARLYASAGLQDYWIVNIPYECIEIFRQPTAKGYQSMQAFEIDETVSALAFPEITLAVSRLFEAWAEE
jgi:Uma2 family endonuclease